jgi:hypothetical protein
LARSKEVRTPKPKPTQTATDTISHP